MERPSVKLQYGILTGERRGRRFRKALRTAGYHVTKDAGEADIIIAHSAGCFWLPEPNDKQRYLLIDPPYWPGRTVQERARSRAHHNLHFREFGYPLRYWAARNLWNMYYAVRDAKRTRRIMRHAPHYDLPAILKGRQVTLVRNEHDDWLTPDLTELQLTNPDLRIIILSGDHDDCMYNPAPYVAFLKDFKSNE